MLSCSCFGGRFIHLMLKKFPFPSHHFEYGEISSVEVLTSSFHVVVFFLGGGYDPLSMNSSTPGVEIIACIAIWGVFAPNLLRPFCSKSSL